MLNLAQPGEDVFPARAGMSHRWGANALGARGFPRTRGDEPFGETATAAEFSFSPHARG